VDEAAHLAKMQAELQSQATHLRHMQHITNEALNEARAQLTGTASRLAAAEQRGGELSKEIITLADQAGQLNQTISRLGLEVAEANSTAAARLARLNELEAEIRAMKASRSWRWTSWLRSIERGPGRR
jgi:chromosome segregation ATPase